MRCLFCGKELPLFKRLTGGEFCSDTHRQQYQQEYSQLALNRLLQAKPQDETKREDGPAPANAAFTAKQSLTDKRVPAAAQVLTAAQSPVVQPTRGARPMPAAKPSPPPKPSPIPSPATSPVGSVARNGTPRSPHVTAAHAQPRAAANAATPSLHRAQPGAMAPAGIAGLVVYRPAGVGAKRAAMKMGETEPATSVPPTIPLNAGAPPGVRLKSADRLSYNAIATPPALPWRARHGRMELRDFTRTEPILDLGAKLEAPWMESATEPVELSFTATPSRTEATPWMQRHREFSVGRVQTGELAALDLSTTGFEVASAPAVPASADPTVAGVQSPAEVASLEELAAVQESATSPQLTPAVRATPPAPDPLPFTQPMPVVVPGISGGKAKPVQIFPSTLRAADAVRIPRYESLPLRPTMVLGLTDGPSKRTEQAKVEATGPAAKTASGEIPACPPGEPTAVNPAAEKAAQRPASPNPSPAASPDATPAAKNPSPVHVRPATFDRWAMKTSAAGTPAMPVRTAAPERKLDKERKPIRVQAEAAPNAADVLPAAPPSAPVAAASGSSEAARASAPPTASPAAPPTAPTAHLAPEPARAGAKSFLSLNATPAKLQETDLGLPKLDLNKVKGREPLWVKITAAAACVLALTGGIWFYTNHNRSPETAAISSLSAGAGREWIENFSPDVKRPRTISVLRASADLSDYTVEFSASVDVKALGWVFRAKDPANFYVGRIEQEKTPGGAAAAFVHFPVVGGVPQERKRSPVALPAGPGTVYKIRFEASGERFTAWIQDRKIEEWTDGRLPSGGAGLYSESGERALLQGDFRVIPRTAASK
ncbi:MAG TPA: hypothetical protein VGR73_04670 [Bryobacteraceae bacterium]|nr:hypothetical protein [Bryobacteraceae bacterium]